MEKTMSEYEAYQAQYGRKPTDFDERWLAEWAAYGIQECEAFLAKHAAFDAYCARRATSAA
jgi:hypothetical protein